MRKVDDISFPAFIEDLWLKIKLSIVQFAYFKRRSRANRYVFATISVLVVSSIILFLPHNYIRLVNNQVVALLMLFLTVTLTSLYGGFGPGIFATVLTAIFSYFTLLRLDIRYHPFIGDVIITIIYLITGTIISAISEARYESDMQKDDFIGLTAHELKNPLASIKGFSELISQHAQKKNSYSKILDYSGEIKAQSEKLLELINDFLDVTKIELGKFTYKMEFFDFDKLLSDSVSQQKIVNPKRKIIIIGKTKKIIYADKYRIGQVITNLITNALKYSPQEKKIEIKTKSSRNQINFQVKDYGIGISKRDQKNIFGEFYRINNKSSRVEGLGLGLFISKQIIKYHDGKLWVKSKEGKGSTFFVEIPLTQKN